MSKREKVTPFKTKVGDIKLDRRFSMRIAFEFGYKCCEEGKNLQTALKEFDQTMTAADEFAELKLS